ncbi:sporulation protein [Domibacillus sp. A3M-37]|uniref:sporulation protein n=1 Tax=Domibacillus sp. A3M-37 TaxID=2962037 RepID=UPI0020B72913|nr:sporulation protein [Domibacillus sp. A3M-37]MCP3764118.1 sporulation protein [Domibacillus sp. A3M-37]
MFKKILAKLGKGAAVVDLRFENRPYKAGETLEGELLIHGGEVTQQINNLSVRFMMGVNTKQGETASRQVALVPISGPFSIEAKQVRHFPFNYTIPTDLPLTRGTVSYFFDTQLDIDAGVDRTDLDYLILTAPERLQNVFNALEHSGFREKATSGKIDAFGQEFEFFPTKAFTGQINELELRFANEDSGIRVWMEVDCRYGYQEIEAKTEFLIENEWLVDKEKLAGFFNERISEVVENPELFRQPFSYQSQYRGGKPHGIGGMVGGLAAGVLGGMLLSEIMDGLDLDGMTEGAADMLGMEEDLFDMDNENEIEEFGDFFDDGED